MPFQKHFEVLGTSKSTLQGHCSLVLLRLEQDTAHTRAQQVQQLVARMVRYQADRAHTDSNLQHLGLLETLECCKHAHLREHWMAGAVIGCRACVRSALKTIQPSPRRGEHLLGCEVVQEPC